MAIVENRMLDYVGFGSDPIGLLSYYVINAITAVFVLTEFWKILGVVQLKNTCVQFLFRDINSPILSSLASRASKAARQQQRLCAGYIAGVAVRVFM